MKVKIKDLRPNPFRDFGNYPRDEEKIKTLMKSVEKTGFWDNILARRKDGKYEIAYGHHRYVVLKRLFKLDDEVDIPVKDLDDWTMIMIMIDENTEEYGTDSRVLNEGIKAAFLYLKEKYVFEYISRSPKPGIVFDGLDVPEKSRHGLLAAQIANELGNPRAETRVYHSLQQLDASEEIKLPKPSDFEEEEEEEKEEEKAELTEEEKREKEKQERKEKERKEEEKKEREKEEEERRVGLSKDAIKLLEKPSYVDRFLRALKHLCKKEKLKIPKAKQIAVAEKLVGMAKFDFATIKKELFKSVQPKKDKKKEQTMELEEYLRQSSNLIGQLDKRVKEMLKIKDILDSDVYEKSVEKTEFKIKAVFLMRNLQKLLGDKDDVRKLSSSRK